MSAGQESGEVDARTEVSGENLSVSGSDTAVSAAQDPQFLDAEGGAEAQEQQDHQREDNSLQHNVEGSSSHGGSSVEGAPPTSVPESDGAGGESKKPPHSGQAGESASEAGGTLPTGTETTSGEDVENQVGGNPSGSPVPVASGVQNGEGETQNPQSAQGTEDQNANSADTEGGTGLSANPGENSPAIGDQGASSPEQAENSSPQGADSTNPKPAA